MPIYEYRCSACGHELEALQKLSEPYLTICPQCSKNALTKLISAAGFHLKGSGWYATDFKHSGAKPAAKGAPKADGDSAGAKGDGRAKPESKAAQSATPASGCGSSCACH